MVVCFCFVVTEVEDDMAIFIVFETLDRGGEEYVI